MDDEVRLNVHAFAEYLRTWLERNNMTQNDLVRKMGISNAAMSNWLAEKTMPDNLTMLIKLERATGVELGKWISLLTNSNYHVTGTSVSAAEVAALDKQLKEIKKRLG